MSYAVLQTDNRALLAVVLVLLVLFGVAWVMGWLPLGAVAPAVGTAYVDATLMFSDYFEAYREEDLPSTVTVYVFDQEDEVTVVRTLDLSMYKSITVEDLVVRLSLIHI